MVLKQPHIANYFGRVCNIELWWGMVPGKSRPVKNDMFPNSSCGGHVENWVFSGSGTILVSGYLVGPWTGVRIPCRSLDCPPLHNQCVMWHHQHTWGSWTIPAMETSVHHLPQWAIGGAWELAGAIAWDRPRFWIRLQLEASSERPWQLWGKRHLRVRHWRDEEGKEGRQKPEISAQGYIRKGPVERSATWRW